MIKRIMSVLLLSMYLFGGFSMLYAEQYCPEDGSACYEVTPLDNTDTPSSGFSPAPTWGGGPSFGSDGGAKVNSNMLQVGGGDNSANASTNVTFKDNFLRNIQVYIMGLLGIVSVGVFLYIGYMLFTAQGKEEDFKNAWKALTYAVIGLAVIPLAYIAVKIVTGFTF